MRALAYAVGLVLILEGALYALMPARIKRLASLAERLPDDVMRWGGVIAAAVGLGIVWLVRDV